MHNPLDTNGTATEEPLTMERRKFLKKVAAGTISATVLLVYRQVSTSGNAADSAATPDGGEPVESQKHVYAYVIDIGKCIGCGNCVRACSAENNVPAGLFRTWVERYAITDDGVYVDSPNGSKDGFTKLDESHIEKTERSWFVPKLCNQCHKPPCVQVCPVGATFKTEEGFVLVDPEHCIACGYCVQGCPYGSRFMDPETKIANKCTWCYHRVKAGGLPACVTVCPTHARVFGDLNDLDSEVSKIFQEDKWMVLRPDMHTDSYCFYVGLPREVV